MDNSSSLWVLSFMMDKYSILGNLALNKAAAGTAFDVDVDGDPSG